MVKCEICGKEFKTLASHIRAHKLTAAMYKNLFPNAKLCSVDHSKLQAEVGRKVMLKLNADKAFKEKIKVYVSASNKRRVNTVYGHEARSMHSKRIAKKLWEDPSYRLKQQTSRYPFYEKLDNFKPRYRYYSKEGTLVKLHSSYEMLLCSIYDYYGIEYKRSPFRIKYNYRGSDGFFAFDFYLPCYDLIVEVKDVSHFGYDSDMQYAKNLAAYNSGHYYLILYQDFFEENISNTILAKKMIYGRSDKIFHYGIDFDFSKLKCQVKDIVRHSSEEELNRQREHF